MSSHLHRNFKSYILSEDLEGLNFLSKKIFTGVQLLTNAVFVSAITVK